MPGIQPAPLSTLLSGSWIIGLVAWAISRARVEHRFAVAMSKYVLPSNDLDHDVERLDHERPDDIARAMGHQLEVQVGRVADPRRGRDRAGDGAVGRSHHPHARRGR